MTKQNGVFAAFAIVILMAGLFSGLFGNTIIETGAILITASCLYLFSMAMFIRHRKQQVAGEVVAFVILTILTVLLTVILVFFVALELEGGGLAPPF